MDAGMKEIISTITSKGQVTIPAAVRQHLGLKRGDKLAFVLADDGSVALAVPTYSTVASLAGAAGSLGQPLSWKEMREIAREEHLEHLMEAGDGEA
jgi:AbrB family looped-hinge helix DNA binding protein